MSTPEHTFVGTRVAQKHRCGLGWGGQLPRTARKKTRTTGLDEIDKFIPRQARYQGLLLYSSGECKFMDRDTRRRSRGQKAASMSGGREKEPGFPGDEWGWQRKSSCTMTLRWKDWACARNGKRASGAGSCAGSRATGSTAQRGKGTSPRLHSQ